jgi:hypothetical protein
MQARKNPLQTICYKGFWHNAKRRERDKDFCITSFNININRYQKYLIINFLMIYIEMVLFG